MTPSLWAWLSLGGVGLLLIAVIWSIRSHRDPILKIYSASAVDQLIPTLAGLTLSTPLAGNSVEVLENGAYFDVLLERIRCADRSVHFGTFLWKDGVLGRVWRARSPSGLARASRCACCWTPTARAARLHSPRRCLARGGATTRCSTTCTRA